MAVGGLVRVVSDQAFDGASDEEVAACVWDTFESNLWIGVANRAESLFEVGET